MWQYVITALILLAALIFVIRQVIRTLKGRDSFSCAFCDQKNCPSRRRNEEKEEEKPPDS